MTSSTRQAQRRHGRAAVRGRPGAACFLEGAARCRRAEHGVRSSALLERWVTQNRRDLERADAKAFRLLGMQGAVSAAVLSLHATGGWAPWSRGGTAAALWWVGCGLWIGASLAFLLVVVPRLRGFNERIRTPHREAGRRGAGKTLVLSVRPTVRRRSIESELKWTSRLVRRKCRFLRAGIVTLIICSLCVVSAQW